MVTIRKLHALHNLTNLPFQHDANHTRKKELAKQSGTCTLWSMGIEFGQLNVAYHEFQRDLRANLLFSPRTITGTWQNLASWSGSCNQGKSGPVSPISVPLVDWPSRSGVLYVIGLNEARCNKYMIKTEDWSTPSECILIVTSLIKKILWGSWCEHIVKNYDILYNYIFDFTTG